MVLFCGTISTAHVVVALDTSPLRIQPSFILSNRVYPWLSDQKLLRTLRLRNLFVSSRLTSSRWSSLVPSRDLAVRLP